MPHKHTHRKPYQEREDLTGEHKIGDAGQLVLVPCFYLAGRDIRRIFRGK